MFDDNQSMTFFVPFEAEVEHSFLMVNAENET
jgi:hypothetical protein